MTPTQQVAFHAGIRHAAEMAQVAALQIELRPDANNLRQRAAIEALRGLAEGLNAAFSNDQAQENSSVSAPL